MRQKVVPSVLWFSYRLVSFYSLMQWQDFLYPAFPYTGNILAFYSEFLQNRLIININKYR